MLIKILFLMAATCGNSICALQWFSCCSSPTQQNKHDKFVACINRGTESQAIAAFDDEIDVYKKYEGGETALVRAAVCGKAKVVEKLIDKRADVHVRDEIGWTALFHAAAHDQRAIVEILIRGNADVEVRSTRNQTPLMYASRNGHEQMAMLLILHKANVRYSYGEIAPWLTNDRHISAIEECIQKSYHAALKKYQQQCYDALNEALPASFPIDVIACVSHYCALDVPGGIPDFKKDAKQEVVLHDEEH